MRLGRVVAVCMLAVFGVPRGMSAEQSCYEYQVTVTLFGQQRPSGWQSSQAAACSALGGVLSGVGGRIGYVLHYTGSSPGGSAWGGHCEGSYVVESTGAGVAYSTSASGAHSARPAECPEDPCTHLAGLMAEGGGTGEWAGESLCRTETHDGPAPVKCGARRAGVGVQYGDGWFGQIVFDGSSCGLNELDVDVHEGGPNCVTGPGGQVCISKTEKNCGTFNGESVCLDDVPPGRCVLLGNGGAICDGSEDSDAGPKNEQGDLLDPSQLMEMVDAEGNVTEVKFFPRDTVSQGVGGVAGVGTAEATGEGVAGPGAGHGLGGDGSSGEGSGEFGGDPDGETFDSESAMSGVIGAVGSIGWVGVFTDTAGALSGGPTCPSVTVDIEFIDASFDLFEAACGYIAPHYSLWTLLMQVAWSLLAMRIFWVGMKS